jgi:hypothetical protein
VNVRSKYSDWVFDRTNGVVFVAGGDGGPGMPINEVTGLRVSYWLVCNQIGIWIGGVVFGEPRRGGMEERLYFLHLNGISVVFRSERKIRNHGNGDGMYIQG